MGLMIKYMSPYKKRITGTLLLKFFAVVFELLIPYILEYMIDVAAPAKNIQIVLLMGAAMIVLAFLARQFNIWGNLRQFTSEDTYFLNPQPDGTITVPSGSNNIITVGGYDSYNNGIYPNTGRGLVDGVDQKPDVVAPSVDVYGAGLNNNFVRINFRLKMGK